MYHEQWRRKGITLFETCFVPAGLQGDIAHATKLRRDSEYNLRHWTSPYASGLSWTCSWPSPSFGSGYLALWCALNRLMTNYWADLDGNSGSQAHEFIYRTPFTRSAPSGSRGSRISA